MKTPLKVATIPIEQLWRDSEWIEATRDRFLTPEETKSIVGDETVPIVVASIMKPMHWPTSRERFDYWNSIKPHLINGTQDEWITDLQEFYVASIWHSDCTDYLLFEHHH